MNAPIVIYHIFLALALLQFASPLERARAFAADHLSNAETFAACALVLQDARDRALAALKSLAVAFGGIEQPHGTPVSFESVARAHLEE
eukprot:6192931-Pleurochrysis_carterae.AAC.1